MLDRVSKELGEIKDTTSVLRKRLAEMMNSLLSDLVSECNIKIISASYLPVFHTSLNRLNFVCSVKFYCRVKLGMS